jgi:hypothetical protein
MADPRRALTQMAQPLIGLALVFIWPGPSILRQIRANPEPEPEPQSRPVVYPAPETADSAVPRDWLTAIEPSCNAVDVMLATDLHPAPTTGDGPALEAACFAIAGDIAKARALVLAMEPAARPQAAGVVLDVALDAPTPTPTRPSGP